MKNQHLGVLELYGSGKAGDGGQWEEDGYKARIIATYETFILQYRRPTRPFRLGRCQYAEDIFGLCAYGIYVCRYDMDYLSASALPSAVW